MLSNVQCFLLLSMAMSSTDQTPLHGFSRCNIQSSTIQKTSRWGHYLRSLDLSQIGGNAHRIRLSSKVKELVAITKAKEDIVAQADFNEDYRKKSSELDLSFDFINNQDEYLEDGNKILEAYVLFQKLYLSAEMVVESIPNENMLRTVWIIIHDHLFHVVRDVYIELSNQDTEDIPYPLPRSTIPDRVRCPKYYSIKDRNFAIMRHILQYSKQYLEIFDCLQIQYFFKDMNKKKSHTD